MDAMQWTFIFIETLLGVIVVFLMFDRKNIGVRFTKLEEGKVDYALFDERTKAITAQVCLIKTENKEDHQELKDGIKEVADMVRAIQLSSANVAPHKSSG